MTINTAGRTALRPLLALALLGAGPVPASEPAAPVLEIAPVAALLADDTVVAAPQAQAQAEIVGRGEASYYGRELAGNRTASGERFDPEGMTAAHRSLPLGSRLKVTNQANGRSVVVRVNDRGPFARARLLDVSYGAARELSMLRAGKAIVTLELLR